MDYNINYKVGDEVLVVGPNGQEYTDGIYWNPRMDVLIQKSGIIKETGSNADGVRVYFIKFENRKSYDSCDRDWVFHGRWLIPYSHTDDEIKPDDINCLW